MAYAILTFAAFAVINFGVGYLLGPVALKLLRI